MSEQLGPDLLLLEKLAAGGMAEVFLGRQLGYGGFEKKVAVKRILQHYAKNEDFKKMFQAEANLSAHLQHTNIAQIFSNGEVEGYLYLVMEFVDGRNARQMLARADKRKIKIPIELSCHLVSEVAKGLEYAHNFHDEKTGEKLDLVHRDMSPQNIMLSYDGAVKIVDFGIAKAASRSEGTRAGVLKGKFGYMSPEQASGMKLDHRTDIFALGIILFELITQRRLFASDDDLKTLNLVKECRVPRPSKYNPSVNPGLDRIVMKALAKEKSERYQTAGALYEDLVRLMAQRYPKFIPTDFTKFFRELFVEDIQEEKKRREKLMKEAPSLRPAVPAARNEATASPAAFDENKSFEATQISNHQHGATQIMQFSEESPQILDLSSSGMKHRAALSAAEDMALPPPASTPLPPPLTDTLPAASIAYSGVRRDAPRSRRPILYGGAVAALLIIAGILGSPKSKPHSTPVAVVPVVTTPVAPSEPAPTVDTPPEKTVATGEVESVPAPIVEASQEVAQGQPAVVEESRDPASRNTTRPPSQTMPGYLDLEAIPRATEIIINGKPLRGPAGEMLTTPLHRFPLPPGKHTIQLRNSAFDATWSGAVEIQTDRILEKDTVLK